MNKEIKLSSRAKLPKGWVEISQADFAKNMESLERFNTHNMGITKYPKVVLVQRGGQMQFWWVYYESGKESVELFRIEPSESGNKYFRHETRELQLQYGVPSNERTTEEHKKSPYWGWKGY